jgi:ketosteroid isomerase-like protein
MRHTLATLTVATLAAVTACTPRHLETPTAAERDTLAREVTAMLSTSAKAWNRGDIDAFMTDYYPGERTSYVTSRGVIHDPARIRERYAPRFAPGGVHDSLSFENVEVDPLAPGVVHVLAWYVLSRGDSTVARGPTSLVMLRHDGRLRIVHDHSG